MFLSKLRPTDSFGLVVFGSTAINLIPVQKVSEFKLEDIIKTIKEISVGGGTTLMSGFIEAHNSLK